MRRTCSSDSDRKHAYKILLRNIYCFDCNFVNRKELKTYVLTLKILQIITVIVKVLWGVKILHLIDRINLFKLVI
jgi:hypothetical protein